MKESIKYYALLVVLAVFVIACAALAIAKKFAIASLFLGFFLG